VNPDLISVGYTFIYNGPPLMKKIKPVKVEVLLAPFGNFIALFPHKIEKMIFSVTKDDQIEFRGLHKKMSKKRSRGSVERGARVKSTTV
jgi:hypothetical protein